MSNETLVRVDHAEVVRSFLDGAKYKFSEDAETRRVFSLRFQTEAVMVEVSIFTGDGYVSIHARLPNIVTKEKIADTSVVLNAISRSVAVGSFELASGLPIVDFKSGFLAVNTPISHELIKQCFESCIYHVNICYPVISALLAESISLEHALKWAAADWVPNKPKLVFGE